MKDCQKRWQPNSTDSVVARLMGFDELRTPQKPFREKHRVLSESYVRNAASVGLRPGSLVVTGRSRSTKNEIGQEVKGMSGLQISKGKNDDVFDKCVDSSASKVKKGIRSPKLASALVSKSSSGASHRDRRSFDKNGASRHVLRYLQKHEHDSLAGHLGELGIDYMKKSLEFELWMKDQPRLFSTSNSAIKPKSDQHFRPGYREHKRVFKSESGKDHQLAYRESLVNGNLSCRHRCVACTRTMSRICRQERRRSKSDELLRTGYMGGEYMVDQVEALVLSSPGVNDFKNHGHDPHHLLDQSSLANEPRKQNFERWKTANDVREVGVCARGQNLDTMLALADKKSIPRNGLCHLSSLQSRNSGSSSPSVYSTIDFWEDGSLKSLPLFKYEAIKEAFSSGKEDESTARDNYLKEQMISQKGIIEPKGGRGYEQFSGVNDTMSPSSKMSESFSCYFSSSGEAYIRGVPDEIDNGFENDRCKKIELRHRNSMSSIRNFAAQCINDATYARAEALRTGVCTRTTGDSQLESIPVILSGESEHSSYVQEVSGEEAFLNEYSEEESSAYSNCSRIGPPEFQDNLKRTFQQSPDSVLEPFDMQNSSTFEHFDSIGLQLQLQALNFDPEETYSEGSVMVLSGDEDFFERFDDLSYDGRKVKTWLGDNKRRNSSYMVDVLDEAGFCGMKSFMEFKTWYSLECPIGPSVFEGLEKKYGEQTSWQKYERRLLFDRINSGLISIFNPVINFHACATSIRSRFYASLRRDEVEDELWMMLISPDKETSNDLSEKAFDKWFETEEGINIICRELETTLFDELMTELASLWD